MEIRLHFGCCTVPLDVSRVRLGLLCLAGMDKIEKVGDLEISVSKIVWKITASKYLISVFRMKKFEINES